MRKLIKSHTFSEKGLAMLAVAVLLLSFMAFEGGSIYGSSTFTVAQTTITSTLSGSTVTQFSTSTFNFTTVIVHTTSSFVTIMDTGPASIHISGTVGTKTPGTAATDIVFTDLTNRTVDAKVTNGLYATDIPNHQSYNVAIKFGTVVANVGAGQCVAGALVVYTNLSAEAANWSC